MKYKKIVGFGDSWMWGDELVDPALDDRPDRHPVLHENTPYRESNCFLGLIGQHYNLPVENFGIPGGSQQSTLWNYLWWTQHEQLDPSECIILVAHTEPNRTSFYNPDHVSYANDPPWNKYIHSAWVHSGNSGAEADWIQMTKLNMVLTDCKELRELTYRTSVAFFEGQNYKLGNNILHFNTAPPVVKLESAGLVWPDRGLKDFIKHRPELLALGGHPNELGHRVIRDCLINEIERVILA